jgi:hypothetical protein
MMKKMVMKKKLVNVENRENGVPGFYASHEGEAIELIPSGKIVMAVPRNEQDHKIYKLLASYCDLYFFMTDQLENFHYYPVPMMALFAVDSAGNHYGTIGGMGDIIDDQYPVGFISKDGQCVKIAESFKAFLELAVYYPDWREILDVVNKQKVYTVESLISMQLNQTKEQIEIKDEITNTLNLTKRPKLIEALFENIKSAPMVVTYLSKEDAEKENVFIE